MFGIGIAVTSVLTLLTPLAAKAGVGALIAVRLIEGIFEVKKNNFDYCNKSTGQYCLFVCLLGRYISLHSRSMVSMGTTVRTIEVAWSMSLEYYF